MKKGREIQREQVQLVQMQKEIEELLGKVNEALNTLKVEELQLRSIVTDFSKVSHNASTACTFDHIAPDEALINSQFMNLTTQSNRTGDQIEEEEDDD